MHEMAKNLNQVYVVRMRACLLTARWKTVQDMSSDGPNAGCYASVGKMIGLSCSGHEKWLFPTKANRHGIHLEVL